MRWHAELDTRTCPELLANRWGYGTRPPSRWKSDDTVETAADLGCWTSPATVLAWVVEEADHLERCASASRLRVQPLPRNPLVYVLGYGYGRQIYDSEEIVRAWRNDPVLRPFCSSGIPFPDEVRRFRRQNRPLLERVVAAVLMRAVRHRFGLGETDLPGELEEDLRRVAAERLDIARHMDAVEVGWT